MKKIKLTQNKCALVDDDMYEYLNQWKWHYSCGRATRTIWFGHGHRNRKAKIIHMHRLVNNTLEGFETDHIDRNPLNNQKSNLRTVTHSKNLHNRPKQKNNVSGYKNIYWDTQTKKWRVQIQIENRVVSLGRFYNIQDAILERNKKWISP